MIGGTTRTYPWLGNKVLPSHADMIMCVVWTFMHCLDPVVWVSEHGDYEGIIVPDRGIIKLEPVLEAGEISLNRNLITKAIDQVVSDPIGTGMPLSKQINGGHRPHVLVNHWSFCIGYDWLFLHYFFIERTRLLFFIGLLAVSLLRDTIPACHRIAGSGSQHRPIITTAIVTTDKPPQWNLATLLHAPKDVANVRQCPSEGEEVELSVVAASFRERCRRGWR
mmetsp:Transcript_29172/g.62030  ORF Transcript_29172/g.62030 Transcript_29172/m.62030 type:complete len:222 (+) Transcript_29172:638-1303(+)